LNLDLATHNALEVNLQILNIHGHLLLEKHEMLPGGDSRLSLQVSDLPKGVYILTVSIGKEYIISRKFLK
jgi:hypothetical protein